MDYVNFVYLDVLSSFSDDLEVVLSKYSLIHTFILLFWLILLSIGTALLVFNFLEKLRIDIWKTRSMLNMIPNEVISHNRALKTIFLDKKTIQTT